jgi:integrase
MKFEQVTGDVWTIDGALMKGRKDKTEDFRVPLSTETLRVMELARPFSRDGFVFPSTRKGVISDAAMARYMERQGLSERPHGFRSSLRTWMAETTDTPHEVAETVLEYHYLTGSGRPKLIDAGLVTVSDIETYLERQSA